MTTKHKKKNDKYTKRPRHARKRYISPQNRKLVRQLLAAWAEQGPDAEHIVEEYERIEAKTDKRDEKHKQEE